MHCSHMACTSWKATCGYFVRAKAPNYFSNLPISLTVVGEMASQHSPCILAHSEHTRPGRRAPHLLVHTLEAAGDHQAQVNIMLMAG